MTRNNFKTQVTVDSTNLHIKLSNTGAVKDRLFSSNLKNQNNAKPFCHLVMTKSSDILCQSIDFHQINTFSCEKKKEYNLERRET